MYWSVIRSVGGNDCLVAGNIGGWQHWQIPSPALMPSMVLVVLRLVANVLFSLVIWAYCQQVT